MEIFVIDGPADLRDQIVKHLRWNAGVLRSSAKHMKGQNNKARLIARAEECEALSIRYANTPIVRKGKDGHLEEVTSQPEDR